jgi:hypothetical protein
MLPIDSDLEFLS